MKKILASLLVVLTFVAACGAKLNPNGTPKTFQQQFVENAQKTYVVLVAVQAIEQEQFLAGKIPLDKHKVIAADVADALRFTLDAEQIGEVIPKGKPAPQEITDLAKAVAKLVDDVQAAVSSTSAPLDLQKKVVVADAAFKILVALFANGAL